MGKGKGINAFLIFVLCMSCSHQDQWSVKHIETVSRLCYHSEDKVGGIDIEMLKNNEQLSTYLQVRAGIIATDKAKLIIEGKETAFTLERHRGGQRFNVPPQMQEMMLQALTNGKSLILKVAGYQEIVEPGEFNKKFQNSSYTIPFHLPF